MLQFSSAGPGFSLVPVIHRPHECDRLPSRAKALGEHLLNLTWPREGSWAGAIRNHPPTGGFIGLANQGQCWKEPLWNSRQLKFLAQSPQLGFNPLHSLCPFLGCRSLSGDLGLKRRRWPDVLGYWPKLSQMPVLLLPITFLPQGSLACSG